LNSTVKQLLIWVLTLGCLLVGWRYVVTNMGPGHDKAISISELLNEVTANKVASVTVNGEDVTGQYKDSKESFHTTIPANYPHFYDVLNDHGVYWSNKNQQGNLWFSVLLNALPILVLLALFMFMMRQMQSGGNKALSFGKNRARLLSMQQKKITFKDVAGVDEAKEELKEIIEFLREAQKFQRLGGRIPQGRADGWASGHGQDAAGACRCWRGECAVLLNLRFGFCGDVCGRRCEPRARFV
jgi:cell division protease FtsH